MTSQVTAELVVTQATDRLGESSGCQRGRHLPASGCRCPRNHTDLGLQLE
jgi:hypothetical protein